MKTCSKCNLEKDEGEFKKPKDRKALGAWCKKCHKEYDKQRNSTARQRKFRQERNKAHKDELRRLVANYLRQNPCTICQENDIVVLEFDHKDPATKEFCIAEAVTRGLSWVRVEKEINKCRVLCANCHRRHTAATLGWYKSL